VLVAWADNPESTTYSDTRGGVRLIRFDGTEVDGADEPYQGVLFPTNPSVAWRDGSAWVAVAGSDMDADGANTSSARYTRHVEVYRVDWGGSQTWTESWRSFSDGCPSTVQGCVDVTPTADADGNTWGRMELPALTTDGDALRLAFVGWSETLGVSILALSESGSGWSTPVRLDESGRVLGHVEPVWDDGTLYWARLSDEGMVEVCAGSGSGGSASCTSTGSPRIAGLSVSEGTIEVSVDAGTAEWVVKGI
jgi:hypothetical protein